MRPLPISVCEPSRKPYSASWRYKDGKGPAPHDFFDETQDHVSALAHAGCGWRWTISREDFDNTVYPTGYLGLFSYRNFAAGLTLAAAPSGLPIIQGEHGVWRGLSGVFDYDFELWENTSYVGAYTPGVPGSGDFLISCKIVILNRIFLDPYQQQGVWMSCGDKALFYPALCSGGDSPTWKVFSPSGPGAVADWFETNATCVDSQNTQPDQLRRAWQVLQISRTDGVLRFHVNGRLLRLTRLAGGLRNVEGIYFPDELPRLRRYFRIKRRFAGLANEGVYLDFFHRAQRRV